MVAGLLKRQEAVYLHFDANGRRHRLMLVAAHTAVFVGPNGTPEIDGHSNDALFVSVVGCGASWLLPGGYLDPQFVCDSLGVRELQDGEALAEFLMRLDAERKA